MTATMHRAWMIAPEQLQLVSTDVPRPEGGEVLVRMAFAGICGSDLGTYRRGHPWLPYPIAPGHEASGIVTELGSSVRGDWQPGDRVYVRPAVACGACFYCTKALPNLCSALIGVGSHTPGAFADYLVVPEAALARVPDGVRLATAALIEPLATAVHAARAVGGLGGRSVAVLGAGTIGLSILLVAGAEGASSVTVTDPVPAKLALAAELGATGTFDAARSDLIEQIRGSDAGRPDVTFDCVGAAATIRSATELAVRGGTVVVVGVGHGPVELPIERIQDEEIGVLGSAMYVPADFERAERLVAEGLEVDRLITDVYPLMQFQQAFAAALSGEQVKVHLQGRFEESEE
jgi:2-desacetyl-2-hydroxyethyl bacteriochlorophyllide A dehydrogenase